MKTVKFDCGCEFQGTQVGPQLFIDFEPDIEKINLDCPAVWDLLSNGNTIGVFQVESQLGQSLCKKVQPHNIEELSAIVAIQRPGSLEAVLEKTGKTITQSYIDRKHNLEPVDCFHPALEPILRETKGLLCIHEESLISMGDGTVKKIKDIKIGDKVISLNEKTNETFIDECIEIGPTRQEKGLELILKNNFRVITTKDHSILTSEGMVECQLLDKNKHSIATGKREIYKNSYSNLFPEFGTDENVAYLLGQLTGDGCAGRLIASGTDENHNKLLPYLEKTFGHILTFRPYFHMRSNYIAIKYKFSQPPKRTKYTDFIYKFGMNFTKNKKTIPDEILQSSKSVQASFLAGLIDSDGHIKNNLCQISSTNQITLLKIRKLCSNLGFATCIDKSRTHIAIRNLYELMTILENKLVIKGENAKTLKDIKSGAYPKFLVKEFIIKNHKYIKPFCKKIGIESATIFNNNFKFCTEQTLEKIGLIFPDISWQIIREIKETKKLQFYGMTLKNNHNFIANGIFVKNCYQEQALQIAKTIAGFTMGEANALRKAIGKKIPEEMAKSKKLFLEKGKLVKIVNDKELDEIFSWIEKSQRYSFNKSHSISYALNAYLSAYCKTHFPKPFFTSYLYYSQNKQDSYSEINKLVNNARSQDINVKSPSLLECNKHFRLLENGDIRFGISDIRGIGSNAFEKVKSFHDLITKETLSKLTWLELLSEMTKTLPSPTILSLINSGSLDHLQEPRTKLSFEYNALQKLSDKEWEKLRKAVSPNHSILSLLIELNSSKPGRQGFASNKNRAEIINGIIKSLQNPPYALVDSPEWVVSTERSLLGTALTVSNLDSVDCSSANTTCLDLIEDRVPEMAILAVQIDEVKEVEIKNGKNRGDKMAFLKVSDQYCSAEDIVIFADSWRAAKNIAIEGNTVLLMGKKDKKKGSLIINTVYQL